MAAVRFSFRQMNYTEAEFPRHIFYDFRGHASDLSCVSGNKRVFTNCVDQAGEAARMLESMGRAERLAEAQQVIHTLELALAALRPELESL